MRKYQIEFNLPYTTVARLKQKEYYNIVGIICHTRLQEFVRLIGPGFITYDENDKKRQHVTVDVLDKFNRNVTNCIVFDLPFNCKNFGYFDKLFVYYCGNDKSGGFNLVIYNSKTNKCKNFNNVGRSYDDIARTLNKVLNLWQNKELYDYYKRKDDALNCRNGLKISDCPTYKDFLDLKEKLKERNNIYFKDKKLFLQKYGNI